MSTEVSLRTNDLIPTSYDEIVFTSKNGKKSLDSFFQELPEETENSSKFDLSSLRQASYFQGLLLAYGADGDDGDGDKDDGDDGKDVGDDGKDVGDDGSREPKDKSDSGDHEPVGGTRGDR